MQILASPATLVVNQFHSCCNLNTLFQQAFGKQYATEYLPDGEQTLTLLRKGKSTTWKVRMVPRSGGSHRQMLTVGWRDFVQDNRLEVEDICLFQQMEDKRLTMTVVS